MQHPKLTAQLRTVLGKRVKHLRTDKTLPGNVFGKGLESRSVEVPMLEFQTLYREVGETGIIDLSVDGVSVPVLVKKLQREVRTHLPLHVEFYQVNLKEKIKTNVPVKLIGEAKAITEKLGLLFQTLNEIEIEALPENLPEAIEADVTELDEVGDMIVVSDLKSPEGVTILTDPEQIVAQISELVQEEKEEPIAEPVVEGEAAVPAEGETPAEGEATPEATKEEKE